MYFEKIVLPEFQTDCNETCFLFGSAQLSHGHRLDSPGFLQALVPSGCASTAGRDAVLSWRLFPRALFPGEQVWVCSLGMSAPCHLQTT